jgi:hypothetical protein
MLALRIQWSETRAATACSRSSILMHRSRADVPRHTRWMSSAALPAVS